LPFLGIVENQL